MFTDTQFPTHDALYTDIDSRGQWPEVLAVLPPEVSDLGRLIRTEVFAVMAGWYERENGRAIDFDVHVSSPVRTSFSVRFMLSDAHRRGLQVIADSGGFMLCSIGPAGKRPLIIFPIDRDKPLNILEPRQPAD